MQSTLISRRRRLSLIYAGTLAAGLSALATAAPVQGPAPYVPPAGITPSTTPATLPVKAKVTEKAIYTVPEGAKVTDYIGSADGRHIACVESKDKKVYIAVDGQRSPPFEWVVGRSLNFSPDGTKLTFQTQHDGLVFISFCTVGPTWNAKEQPGAYLAGRVMFSPDGKRNAYGIQKERNGKMTMVVDGVEGLPFDEVYSSDMFFSPDSKRFAYKVRNGDKQMYVVDGQTMAPYELVTGLVFSSNSARYGYRAKSGSEAVVVIDGKPGKGYPLVAGLALSPDGKKYTYVIEAAGADSKPTGKQQLVFNPGTVEQVFSPVDAIGAVAFSPDSNRLAMTALSDKRWSVVVDGKIGPGYEASGALLFSPDSKRLALVAGRTGQQFLVIDGRELPPVDAVAFASFSPDSSRIAYFARSGQQSWLMLDDKRIGPGSFFAFSPDSKRLGHAVQVNNGERWNLAIDGQALQGEYDLFLSSKLVWDSATSARIIAARDTTMYAVQVELQP